MNIEKRNKIILFILGSLLGLSVFLMIYGFKPLSVTNDDFLRGGYIEQDVRQHYAGWLFYRNAPLSIPFCISPDINWPQGMSIAFTDSIPLFAAFFRLLSPILPGTFQYFGIFTALCFMLQGGFAALLLNLFTSKCSLCLLGALPFVSSPILIERAFRHTSLAAHFFILAAIYYYLLSHKENRYRYKGLFIINCLSITIHPYFVPMTFAITFALLIEYCVRKAVFFRPFLWLCANLAGCFAFGWLFGVFSSAGSGAGGSGVDYGFFSMNLNALWNPTSRGNIIWSRILPVQNQVGGNYDGFNYLGFGILAALLLLFVLLLVFSWRSIPKLLCTFWGACTVSICLTCFAITHIITANGATLAALPLPRALIAIATTLRSSGRMFWPVYYALMLFAVIGVLSIGKSISGRYTPVLALVILCSVQLFDLSPALIQKSNSMRHYSPVINDIVTGSTPMLCETTNFFALTHGKYEKLAALDQLTYTGISLALYSADENMLNTDTSFFARYDEGVAAEQRNNLFNELNQGLLPANTLYVTEKEETFLSVAPKAQEAGAWCAALQADEGSGAKTVLYVIAPCFSGADVSLSIPFSDNFPVHIPDYSDDYWNQGVLSLNLEQINREHDKNRVVFFYDSPFIREKLNENSYIVCDGRRYSVLKVDDRDEGMLIVTLDIEDAHILVGKDLFFAS